MPRLPTRLQDLLRKWKAEPFIPLALLLIAGGLLGFIHLSEEVGENEYHAFDKAVLLSMRVPGHLEQPLGPAWMPEMARDFTALGGFTLLTALTLASTGIALLHRKPRIAVIMVLAISSGMLVSDVLKKSFDRPRPDLVPHGVLVSSASFPSGHAMMSAVVYLTLGVLLARTQPTRALRVYLISLSCLATLATGISRVYLGVHWPTDVLAGWTLGAAWALSFGLLAVRLEASAKARPSPPT
ncbi:MAG: phosphoesterase PA-phosphatase related protein [Akkermansiaceae bacterium]|nr:phosphoesterase PA-phosphatase related protein [Akkermansiaceae bacterium]